MRECFEYDVVVLGGGIAGTIAAISAARLGSQVALIQDRPVLGGNSSSEIRVSPVGADFNNRYARESGVIEEVRSELTYRDRWGAPHGTGRPVPIWDSILWQWTKQESNLTCFLNTRVIEPVTEHDRIVSVYAEQASTERALEFGAPIFVDCSGDGAISGKAGADFVSGQESFSTYNESRAPDLPTTDVLSPTLTFSAQDAGEPVEFIPPPWAYRFEHCSDLEHRFHARKDYGYWWIEYGGQLDPVKDAEEIRDELLRLVYGVWDHIKNHCDGSAANYVLNFVGSVLGKRESRRFLGDHILIQGDLEQRAYFEDAVAFGGWPLDHLHPAAGIFSSDPPGDMPQRHHLMEKNQREYPKGVVVKHLFANPPSRWPEYLAPLPGLYNIPLRSLYSRNIENLLLGGRLISASHIAFGSTRVQGTTAVVGQAVGTAAHYCVVRSCTPRELRKAHIGDLQQTLLREDCYIIGVRNNDPADAARQATVTASSERVFSGAEQFVTTRSIDSEYQRGYTQEEGQHYRAEVGWPMSVSRGQMFYYASQRLDAVSLLIGNESDRDVPLHLTLHRADELGIFTEHPLLPAARGVALARLSPQYIHFAFDINVDPGLLWVELSTEDPGVIWYRAGESPIGTYRGAWFPEYGKWDRLFGCHVFRVEPVSHIYPPSSVINGVARPEVTPNIWISDPHESLPQWLELSWSQPIRLGYLQLVFDTDLDAMRQLGNVGVGPSPACIRDYTLSYEASDGSLVHLLDVARNYFRVRRHEFAPVETKRVRLDVTATNGDPSARVYEVRAYGVRPAVH